MYGETIILFIYVVWWLNWIIEGMKEEGQNHQSTIHKSCPSPSWRPVPWAKWQRSKAGKRDIMAAVAAAALWVGWSMDSDSGKAYLRSLPLSTRSNSLPLSYRVNAHLLSFFILYFHFYVLQCYNSWNVLFARLRNGGRGMSRVHCPWMVAKEILKFRSELSRLGHFRAFQLIHSPSTLSAPLSPGWNPNHLHSPLGFYVFRYPHPHPYPSPSPSSPSIHFPVQSRLLSTEEQLVVGVSQIGKQKIL